jgi:sterol desaturase/sphingolipid hydroxylase (fatty acid hydroxylase superfamily)
MGAWTFLEYLVHRFGLHRYFLGRRLHQLHHDHPSDPDAERSSLSSPLIAFPMGVILIGAAGVQDGSGIFAGLLLGYLIFITIHFDVHRSPIEPYSWLYPAKMRHLTHHRLEICNYGVTTGFWDVVSERMPTSSTSICAPELGGSRADLSQQPQVVPLKVIRFADSPCQPHRLLQRISPHDRLVTESSAN